MMENSARLPDWPRPRRQGPECLSDLALDQLALGELAPAQARAAETHLGACPACAARRDALAAPEPLPARAPALHLVGPPEPVLTQRPGRLRWLYPAAGLLAAAATLAAFVWSPGAPETRRKGSGGWLGFYVKHGEAVRQGRDGEQVEEGDLLRFSLRLPRPGHVAILSLDGAGRASVYYPAGEESVAAPAGAGPLEQSTRLDAALGEERIYGLLCREPVRLEPLRRALEETPSQFVTPAGCELETLRLDKVGGLKLR